MTKPQRSTNTAGSDYNAEDFHIRRVLSEINTAEPVTVDAVDIPDPKGPVGFVDVSPLTMLVDGEGKGMAQGTQFRLPYFRIQGGKNAVILDPQPGDKGLAVYAMRDTEALKETRGDSGPVNPGSGRTLDQGDGFYLGGFLNGAPERWVWIHDDGVEIEGKDSLHTYGKITVMNAENGWTVNAPSGATINGDLKVNGSITWTGTARGDGGGKAKFSNGIESIGGITDNGKDVGSTHTHSGVQSGDSNTGAPS
jgi:hypothetical protein